MSSPIEEILSQIPMSQLAGQLGVDEQTAETATRQALPALLTGIQANTDDPGGASSFARAVEQHDGSLVEGGVDLDQVDTNDGDRIVSHVFGPNREQVVDKLGAVGGVGGNDIIAKLLPILAPIVMAWLSKQLTGQMGGQMGGQGAPAGAGGMGDILGSVLGSVLGGGSQSQAAPAGPAGGLGGLGDLLGGLLGGGRR